MEGSFVNLYAFPDEWPVAKNIEIFRHVEEGYTVILYSDISAKLKVTILENKQKISSVFQPISFDGEGVSTVVLTIKNKDINLYIDTIQVKQNTCDILVIRPRINCSKKYTQIYENTVNEVISKNNLLEIERNFIEILVSLEQKILIPNGSSLKEASASLRALLLDNLIERVNAEYKIDLNFPTFNTRKYLELNKKFDFSFQLVGLSFPTKSSKNMLNNSLSEFLKIPCIFLEDNMVLTVKDIIRVWANSRGGVHFGKPKGKNKDREEKIIELDKKITTEGKDSSLVFVLDIAKITLRALEPLKNAILK